MAKIQIKRCWEITLVDDNGELIRYENQYGELEPYMTVTYGSKEDAEKEGKKLLEFYEKEMKEEQEE